MKYSHIPDVHKSEVDQSNLEFSYPKKSAKWEKHYYTLDEKRRKRMTLRASEDADMEQLESWVNGRNYPKSLYSIMDI